MMRRIVSKVLNATRYETVPYTDCRPCSGAIGYLYDGPSAFLIHNGRAGILLPALFVSLTRRLFDVDNGPVRRIDEVEVLVAVYVAIPAEVRSPGFGHRLNYHIVRKCRAHA